MPDRSGLEPAMFFVREILCTLRLAGILNHFQIVFSGQLKDWIHVGHLAIEMHGDDCRDHTSGLFVKGTLRFHVPCALRFEILTQLRRIHCIILLVDIDEVRTCSRLRNCLGGGDECIRNRDDNVTGPYTRSDEGKPQCVCTTGHSYTKTRLTELCKILLKSLNHGAADESCRIEGGLEDIDKLILQFPMDGYEIEKRNWLIAHVCLLTSNTASR